MPAIQTALVSLHRDGAAILEETATGIQPGHPIQNLRERHPGKSLQLVLGHYRHDAGRVGQFFGELRRRRNFDVG